MDQSNKGQVGFDDVLRFQMRRVVTNVFKSFLVILEDVANEHDQSLSKLVDALPPEYKVYVKLADYLDESKSETLRHKVLDIGNNGLRELEQQLDNYDIILKRPN